MYRAFVDGGKFEENLAQMEKNGTYAADAEIRAMTTICNRSIEVFHDDSGEFLSRFLVCKNLRVFDCLRR